MTNEQIDMMLLCIVWPVMPFMVWWAYEIYLLYRDERQDKRKRKNDE